MPPLIHALTLERGTRPARQAGESIDELTVRARIAGRSDQHPDFIAVNLYPMYPIRGGVEVVAENPPGRVLAWAYHLQGIGRGVIGCTAF